MTNLVLPVLPRTPMFLSIEDPMVIEWQDFFRNLVNEIGYSTGFGSPSVLTLSAGTVTISGVVNWRFHSIDTEGDAASDDLTTISGGNTGEVLILQAVNDDRTVVCKDGTSLKLSYDFSLNNTEDKLMLLCIAAGIWHELSRSSNGS